MIVLEEEDALDVWCGERVKHLWKARDGGQWKLNEDRWSKGEQIDVYIEGEEITMRTAPPSIKSTAR